MIRQKKVSEKDIRFDDSVTDLESVPAEHIAMPDKKRFVFFKRGKLEKKEKIYLLIAISVILAIGGGLLWWLNQADFAGVDSEGRVKKPAAAKFYSPLSGIETDEAATKRPVTAVMIENSPDARPQSGLADAEVVFEAVAEGGITRFIALYQVSRPDLIGPVRSLRPYYLEWAAGFNASIAHVGGSPEALGMVRSGNYGTDLDQFFNAGTYWRATDRYAPHNVYTSFDRLDQLNQAKGHNASSFSFAPRADAKPAKQPDATAIDISVSSGLFSVSYAYNAEKNSYDRRQGDQPHSDREKGQLSPKVVIALKTSVSLSGDGTHMSVSTAGSGTAYVFQNGTVAEGTWSKESARAQLFIKDSTGKEIPLNRGQTWVTTVGNERGIAWR